MEMTRTHRAFIHYYRQKYPKALLSDFRVLANDNLSCIHQYSIKAMEAVKALEGESESYCRYAGIYSDTKILFNNARMREHFFSVIYEWLILEDMRGLL